MPVQICMRAPGRSVQPHSEFMESAAEVVGNTVQASQDAIETIRQRGQETLPVAADSARAAMDRIVELSPSVKERDQILLGAAALALAAAVGIAAQRRFNRYFDCRNSSPARLVLGIALIRRRCAKKTDVARGPFGHSSQATMRRGACIRIPLEMHCTLTSWAARAERQTSSTTANVSSVR